MAQFRAGCSEYQAEISILDPNREGRGNPQNTAILNSGGMAILNSGGTAILISGGMAILDSYII